MKAGGEGRMAEHYRRVISERRGSRGEQWPDRLLDRGLLRTSSKSLPRREFRDFASLRDHRVLDTCRRGARFARDALGRYALAPW